MTLASLHVLHRVKASPADSVALAGLACQLSLDTCQRQLWVTAGEPDADALPADVSVHTGEAGWALLLRVATGLESQVVGETEVFAQIKQAWQTASFDNPDALLAMLTEDVRFVRTQYVAGFGGQSYGTLVRKYAGLTDTSRVLIAGAGDLAASVATVLSRWPLILHNRTTARAHELAAKLQAAGHDVLVADNEFPAGITDVVVCRPADAEADLRLAELPNLRSFFHLGTQRESLDELPLADHVRAAGLDDLLTWQATADRIRSAQVARAKRACSERATLRNMGPSVTLPHGWEDLALFA